MKKVKRTGKKVLSVFLAVLMVLTTWVFVAPTEAQAANPTYYYVEILWSVADTKSFSNNFTGTESEGGARAGMILYYKDTNGTATAEKSVYWDIGNGGEAGGTFVDTDEGYTTGSSGPKTTRAILSGFPTAFFAMIDSDAFWDGCKYDVTEIKVGSSSGSDLDTTTVTNKTTIWKGTGHLDTTTNIYTYKLTSNGDGTSTAKNSNDSYGYISTDSAYTKSWVYPYAYNVTWTPAELSAMVCPDGNDSTAKTQNVSVVATDQYGVQMFNPTWSISSNKNNSAGIYLKNTTASSSNVINVTSGANTPSESDTSQEVTVKATWDGTGTDVTKELKFTLTDAYYKATFEYKTQKTEFESQTVTEEQEGYHGKVITAPSIPGFYSEGNYDYAFLKWEPTFNATLTSNVNYKADYDEENKVFVSADYTAVEAAKNQAQQLKDELGITKYNAKYTDESKAVIEKAISDSEIGYPLGRTSQSQVDDYATAIENALLNLEPKKFDVIFLSKDGALLKYEKDVEFETTIEAPEFSESFVEKYYDSTNHYTFKEWDTNEYTSVTDDLVISPVYTAEAHTYTTETVESNCVTKGATKYICACGYSYIDGESNYGDHVWKSEFEVDLEPTCTVAGSKSIHCSLCSAQKDITPIEPLGHIWSSQSVAVNAGCTNIGLMAKVCDECGVCEHTEIPATGHSFTDTAVNPTCTQKGYTVHTCQNPGCDMSYVDTYTDRIDHSYPQSGEVVEEPSCGISGIEKFVCTECGDVDLRTIAALEHDNVDSLSWTVILTPTCEGKGYQIKTCSKCGVILARQEIEANGHTTTTETKAATCTEAGYTKVICSVCTKVDTTIIDPLGHDWDNGVEREADCTHGAHTLYTCQRANCGEKKYEVDEDSEALGHSYTVFVSKTEADCETDGEEVYKCSRCDEEKVTVIPKLGHNYKAGTAVDATCTESGYTPYTCENCGDTYNEYDAAKPATGHTWKSTPKSITAATCEDNGSETYECQNCDEEKVVVIPRLGHKYEKQGETVAATCTTPATENYKCSQCNDTYTKYVAAANGHKYGDWETVTAATADKHGVQKRTCSVCGDVQYGTIAPIGNHNFKEEITKNATCTETGTKTFTCESHSNCSANYTETIPATGHKEKLVYVAPSCSVEGSTKIICETCKETLSTVETIPTTSHNYTTETITQKPTCTQDGVKTFTCSCGATITEPIGKTGHVLSSSLTKPGCLTPGSVITVCNNGCGFSITTEVPAKGHNLKVTTNPASCTVNGSVIEDCENCDYVKTTEIAAKGHNFSGTETVVTPATCTVPGSKNVQCKNCTEVNVVVIPATGHNYKAGTAVDATCTESGYTPYTCENCSDTYNKFNENPSGHNFSGEEVVTVEPTCLDEGEKTVKCTKCSTVETRLVSRLGHSWGDWQTIDPTAASEGSKTRTCARGCTETVTLPKLGHEMVVDKTLSTPPKCEVEGEDVYVCTTHENCGYTLKVKIAPVGHTFDGGKVTTDPTCTADGVKTFTCACGVTRTETVAKTGHSLSTTLEKAKCEEKGKVLTKCAKCTYEISTEIPQTGHTWDDGVTTPASCKTEGRITYTCQNENCGATKEVVLDKLQHVFVETETVGATCLVSGYKVFECECGEGYYEISGDAKGHSWKEVENSSTATCTDGGTKTLECSACAQTMEVSVPAKGHSYKAGTVTPATCTEPSSTVYECACGDKYVELTATANGHKWSDTWTTVVEATTDKNGVEKRGCTVSDCTAEEYRTIQPIGDHTFEEKITVNATCEVEGEKTFTCTKHANCVANYKEIIPATGHTETISVTDATCEAEGSSVTSCTVCLKTLKTETIPQLGHLWSDGTVTKNATCLEKGEISYTCLRNAAHTKTTEIEVNSNAHVFVEATVTAATCEKDGTTVYSCACKKEVELVTEKANGHKWNEEKTVDKAADCSAPGLKSTHCSKCDAIKDAEAIPDTHIITINVSASNCTEKGNITESCANCGYEKITDLEALGHNYSGTRKVEKSASCTEDGLETVQCTRCSATTNVVIPKLGHSFGEWDKTPATNDADGKWTRTCENDASHIETIIIPKGGHDLVEDKGQYVKPTCNSKGQIVYVCGNADHKNCSVKVTVELDYAQHTVCNEIIDASCTKEGSIRTYCSECSKELSDTITTSKLPHTYVELDAVAPTCTTSGYTPYKCSCGSSYNVYDSSNPALGHELVEGASTASCLSEGTMVLSCNNCSYETSVKVPALGHDYAVDSTTEADCSKAATETYKCSRCSASYTVSVGTKTENHQWNQWTVVEAATPSSLGYETRKCNVCGELQVRTINATGEHNYTVEKAREEATCTVDGWIEYSCSTHTDCGLTSKVKIPATGHKETLSYKAATCDEAGYANIVCSVANCNEVIEEQTIPALGHLWKENKVTPSTCNDKGSVEYVCTRTDCSGSYVTELELNPNAHQYSTTVVHSDCTNGGKVITECAACSSYEEEALPALGHKWDDGEIKNGDEATCTKEGTKTYNCEADGCDAVKTEPVEMIGHSWSDWGVSKKATNSENGVISRECSECGETEEIEFPAGGHKLEKVMSTNATCTATGSWTYDCTVHTGSEDCGISITVELDMIPHDTVTTTKAASCEEEGFAETKCKVCGKTEKTIFPATGHTYDSGVKTDATCTKEGKIIYTCQNSGCNDKKEVVLEKIQHKYEEGETVAPTCTQSGYTNYKCENCTSAYVIINVSANGHTLKEGKSTADCLNGGNMTLTCEKCTYETTVKVPALGHNYSLDRTAEATCADEATETYKCSLCGDEYTVSVGQKSTTHSFGGWVTGAAATNTSLGYRTRTCDVCGQLDFEIIPATGEHVFDKLQSKVDATCEENGKEIYSCSVHTDCTETSEVILPATGHKETLSYKAATCGEAGYAKVVCSVANCNKVIEEQTIPALGHIWGNEQITAPSCVNDGKVEFTCTRCNNETKIVTIPTNADAHTIKTETTVKASCKNEGKVVTSCTLCSEVLAETTLPKLQHTWSEWETSIEATNTANGEKKRVCDNGCVETVVIPKGGHTFADTPDSVDAATCAKEGTATYNCTAHANCGVTITTKLAKIQHSLDVETEDATCTKAGLIKVYCTSCKAVLKEITTAMIAHNFKAVETVAPTCLKSGYTTYKCENCEEGYSEIGADATGHTWNTVAESTDNPTCEENGTATYKCKFCDATNVVTIAKTGHAWGSWSVVVTADGDVLKRVCLNNGEHYEEYKIPAGGHGFDLDNPSSTKDGSCVEMGSKTFICNVHTSCGVSITVPTEYGEHDWNDFVLTPGADKDTITRSCKNDASHTESYDIPSGGHEYDLSNPVTVEGDCKTQGTSTFKCKKHTNCGETLTVNIGFGKHSFKTDRKNPTCEENGFIRTYCSVCDETISNEVLLKTNHNYDKNGDGFVDVNDAVYTPAKQNPDGTWTEGYYTYSCQNGGCSNKYQETVAETFEVRFFNSLGEQIGETQNVKLGQSAKEPDAPQKKADGNYHYIFSGWDRKFEKVTKDIDVYPLYDSEAHRGGVATCKEKAECEVCSEPYGDTDTSKHIIVSDTVAATCEKDGAIIYTCSEGCGYKETKVIKKSGHILSDWVIVIEGNCKTESVQIRRCLNSNCNLVEERSYIEPHSFIITKGSEPTCTKPGLTDHKYCVVCELEEGGDVIPVKDHIDLNGDGKCDYCGYSEAVPKCTCMCHSDGFLQIIYKIFRFFWIITRTQQKCDCGANHW